jgi:hypothetical protein
MTDVQRTYIVHFNGRPTIQGIVAELEHAAKVINQYRPVEIQVQHSTEPENEEVEMVMRDA